MQNTNDEAPIPGTGPWLTIKQTSEAEPAFSEPAIRNYVFHATRRKSSKGEIPGNGLGPYVRRLGRKVLIDLAGFRWWIKAGPKSRAA